LLEADALARRKEGDRAEPYAVALNRQCVEIGHEPPLGRQLIERHIDAFAPGVGRRTVNELGFTGPIGRSTLFRSLRRHFESPLFIFADPVEVLGKPGPRSGAQRRAVACVELGLFQH
jgi:hypothetical protein